jgi:transposase
VNYATMSCGLSRNCIGHRCILPQSRQLSLLFIVFGNIPLTFLGPICYFSRMENHKKSKRWNLKKAGLFNPNPEKVKDTLFLDHPDFFDPCDQLQVRYEMLRSHLIERDRVVGLCKRFGISRQTFYTLQEKFKHEGTAGLLPKRPGPRGPWKLTEGVLEFVQQCLETQEHISAVQIKTKVQERFGVSLHKRTIEKLCRDLSVKKNSGK